MKVPMFKVQIIRQFSSGIIVGADTRRYFYSEKEMSDFMSNMHYDNTVVSISINKVTEADKHDYL